MTRTKTLTGLVLLSLLGFASPLAAQSTAPVRYFYDDLGRLTKVVDPSGNVATYNYDAVGNLLSIARSTLSSLNARAIFGFTPQRGGIGESPANTQRATPFLKLDLDPPSGEITCLGFSAKRNIFLAGALNSWVYFWTADDWHKVLALRPEAPPKAKAGKHQPEYRELTACAISPDGMGFALGTGDTVSIFALLSGNKLEEMRSPADALAYSPDGKRLAAGHGTVVEVWDTGTWVSLAKLNLDLGKTRAGPFNHSISALDFSSDGNLLAAATDKGLINVWNTGNSAGARLFLRSDNLDEHTHAIAFSPDGRFLAAANWGRTAGENAVYVWRSDSGDQVAKLEGHRDHVWAVAFSPDGRVLATGDVSGAVRFWTVGDWKEVCSFSAGNLYAVAYSPDSKWFVTGGGDISASIWKNPPCPRPVPWPMIRRYL